MSRESEYEKLADGYVVGTKIEPCDFPGAEGSWKITHTTGCVQVIRIGPRGGHQSILPMLDPVEIAWIKRNL